MIACLDVAYGDEAAYAAGITAREWTDASALQERVVHVRNVQPYESGQFFRRELPCLLAVLKTLRPLDVVIADGYVWLGDGRPGLGAHLYHALGENIPIIGVAKTRFKGANSASEVVRGGSNRPLFVTAAGMDQKCAAAHISSMHGVSRVPTLLKRVDKLCRHAQVAAGHGVEVPFSKRASAG